MTGRLLHALAKGTLVLLATCAGAAAGALLSGAFVEATMPGAGFEALGPLALGTVAGSVLGPFAALAAMFKTPRLQREHAAFRAAAAVGLLLIGALGLLAMTGGAPAPLGAMLAVAGLPLGVLMGTTTIASLAYGRRNAGYGRSRR